MPRHRKPPEPGRINRVYMRLPTDVFERIEARAKGEGRPFHRIIVDELALFPHLFRQARLSELVRDMETVLARYGSRITVTEVNEALLHAVDEALAARTEQPAAGAARSAEGDSPHYARRRTADHNA